MNSQKANKFGRVGKAPGCAITKKGRELWRFVGCSQLAGACRAWCERARAGWETGFGWLARAQKRRFAVFCLARIGMGCAMPDRGSAPMTPPPFGKRWTKTSSGSAALPVSFLSLSYFIPFVTEELPMQIGSVTLNGFALLAPMAGVTDEAYRSLCARFGAAATIT